MLKNPHPVPEAFTGVEVGVEVHPVSRTGRDLGFEPYLTLRRSEVIGDRWPSVECLISWPALNCRPVAVQQWSGGARVEVGRRLAVSGLCVSLQSDPVS